MRRRREDYGIDEAGMIVSYWTGKELLYPYVYNKDYGSYGLVGGQYTYEQIKRKEYNHTLYWF